MIRAMVALIAAAFASASFAALVSPVTVAGTPSVTSCGTGATVSGSNIAGKITTGTGTVTSCTLTFSQAMPTTPVCMATRSTTGITFGVTTTTTSATILVSASSPSLTINYICVSP